MNGILLPRNDINFPLVKVIVRKIAYKNRWKTKNEHFLTRNYRKVVLEIFSETLGISYCSKTCSNRPGLSSAPTADRFGHVEAIKDTIKEKWIPAAPEAPLKKKRTNIEIFFAWEVKIWKISLFWPRNFFLNFQVNRFSRVFNIFTYFFVQKKAEISYFTIQKFFTPLTSFLPHFF